MKLFYHPIYSQLDLPAHHRFPISKYQQLFDMLCAHPELKSGFTISCAEPISVSTLELAHDADYVHQFITGTLADKAQKRIGFCHSDALVERTLQSVGNTLGAAQAALKDGAAMNLAGGYHHAFGNYGSGFCIFNDAITAARYLYQAGLIDNALIIDLDVHQGDGSAAIAERDDAITTLSLHGERNFPRIKQSSDYDFALPLHCDDRVYLETLAQALKLTQRLHRPDIIFYNAGADVHSDDELGTLSLSLDGVGARDAQVLTHAKHHEIPICTMLGGGYQRNLEQLVKVHWQLLKQFHQCFILDS